MVVYGFFEISKTAISVTQITIRPSLYRCFDFSDAFRISASLDYEGAIVLSMINN